MCQILFTRRSHGTHPRVTVDPYGESRSTARSWLTLSSAYRPPGGGWMPGAGCLLFLTAHSPRRACRQHAPMLNFGKQTRTVTTFENGHREAFIKARDQPYGRNHSP